MDIELLRTFLAVSQVRHFGRAADQLFLTPAAVSARIRQLEQTLGVTLFHRTRGNIRLTDEGERLLPHARKLQEAWTEAQRELSLRPQSLPMVRIGCPPGLWPWLSPLLRPLQAAGTLQLTLETCAQREIPQRIAQQRLDLGLLLEEPFQEEIKTIAHAGERQLQLCHTPQSSGAARRVFIQLDWGTTTPARLPEGIAVDATLHANDPAIALQHYTDCYRLAWLPEDFIGEISGSSGFTPLAPDDPANRLRLRGWLACRAAATSNPLLQELLESLAQH